MHVEEIDARTAPDEILLAIHEIEAACTLERPFRPATLSFAYYRHWSDGIRRRFVARREGEIDGAAVLMVPSPTFALTEIFVRPAARRRGLGAALLEAVEVAAREEGMSSFFGHHATEEGAAFAHVMGGVDGQREVASEARLREADIPEPVLPAGWRLRSWRGAAPEELIETYARARAAIDDAPAPGDFTLGNIDVEWVRNMEKTAADRNREIWATVAIDERGEIGSFTDVRTSPAPSPVAGTDDSATAAWARRRGLATAVKCESLRLLRESRPDVEVVRTLNAEENLGMRTVNTRAGFIPTYVRTTTVVTL
jgi:GNAT superfamily N-acetyltransferase